MDLTFIEANAFAELKRHLGSLACQVSELERKLAPPTKEKYIDTTAVCLTLNLSKRVLQCYRDQGIIPYTRLGNAFYYRETDIMQLLEENKFKRLRTKK